MIYPYLCQQWAVLFKGQQERVSGKSDLQLILIKGSPEKAIGCHASVDVSDTSLKLLYPLLFLWMHKV